MGAGLPAVDLGAGRRAIAIAAGNDTTCAVLDTHEIKCWGWNPFGMLGLGDLQTRGDLPGSMGDALPAVDLGPGALADGVAVGNYHTCALVDGSLRCWGDATSSSGLGANTARRPGPWATRCRTWRSARGGRRGACSLGSIPPARSSMTARRSAGVTATEGRLGLGDAEPHGNPVTTMGDALPAGSTSARRGGAVTLAPSSYSTCAILDDGSTRCWGSGEDLGLGAIKITAAGPGRWGRACPRSISARGARRSRDDLGRALHLRAPR
ncbi:MAG: RCC1 domain-containing protein [Byssovorax sp.]